MTTTKREKIRLFVKEYLDSSDVAKAARVISKCTDRKSLLRIGREYLNIAEVQDAIEEAETFTLDRDGIARALSEILTGSNTVDQKIKASNALEKLTRYGDVDDKSTFQDDFERFLVDYGDVLEEFMGGDSEKFNEIFRPTLDSKGQIQFHLKKNLSHTEKKLAMIVLLRTLILRNVFSSS